jgi:hypothetical protein
MSWFDTVGGRELLDGTGANPFEGTAPAGMHRGNNSTVGLEQ